MPNYRLERAAPGAPASRLAILGSYIPSESERRDRMRGPGSLDPGGHDCCCESVCPCYPVS